MNLTEDYCSFELSELLREKGFDGLCHRYDFEDWRGRHTDTVAKFPNNFNKDNGSTSIPTHQMAMKWLRAQGIRICIDYNNVSGDWYATIAKEYDGQLSERIRSELFTLYEDAVEAALKYVLENLI